MGGAGPPVRRGSRREWFCVCRSRELGVLSKVLYSDGSSFVSGARFADALVDSDGVLCVEEEWDREV